VSEAARGDSMEMIVTTDDHVDVLLVGGDDAVIAVEG
jgi:hypothetical protein